MKRNLLPTAIATLGVITIGAFAAWMTDGPRILTAACNAPNGNQFDLAISSFSVSPSLVVGTGTVVTFSGTVVSVPPGYYSGPADWSPYGATPSFTVPGTYTNIGSGTYTDTFGHVCHSASVTAEVDVVGFGLNPAYTGFWGIAGASVTVVVTGFVPRGVSWDISAPHGISVSTTHTSATLTADGTGSGIIRLTATAIGAANEGSGGLVQGGEPNGSAITATAWVSVALGESSSPTLICTKGIHPRHAVNVDRACYLHLWGSYPWHAVFDAGDPLWGFNDHTTSGPEVMFLRGLETGCFVEDEESLEFTFPPLTDPTLINFFTVLDLKTFTATVCDQNAIANQYQHGGRLRIARNVDPIDLQLSTMPQLYVFTDDLLLWEFARDDEQLAYGDFPRTAPRTTSFAVHPETFEPGANYTLNAWFDCDNENDKAGVRASDESTLHIHVSVMDLDIWATDASGYSPDPNEAVDGWMQEWAILGQNPGFTALHIADPGVYEGILCVSWPSSPDASMNVFNCSVPYTMSEDEETTTLMFDLSDMSSADFPIDISVFGQMDPCGNIPVTLRNDLYCGYDEITLVPYAFNIRAHGHRWNGSEYRDLPDTDWMLLRHLELCSHPLVNGAQPEMDIDVNVFGVASGEVNWDIVRAADRSPALEWTVQNGNFASRPMTTKCTAPGKYILRAWVNCGGNNYTTGPDAGEQQREIRISVENLQLMLHPKTFDFDSLDGGNNKCKVMISAALDQKYHTIEKTTKGNTVAQTEDGKIKITAHLTPAYACEDLLVSFRVKDPPDLSPYVTGVADDNKPSTNVPEKGKLNAMSGADVCSVLAKVANINDQTVAAAEVELTITDQHAGNNYIVECSLDGFATPPADATDTLVAWKRVYYKHHKMWKKSTDLASDFIAETSPPSPPPNSVLKVKNASDFSVGEPVVVFDTAGQEDRVVLGIDTTKTPQEITVACLTKDYFRGYRLGNPKVANGRGAAVASKAATPVWYETTCIDKYLQDAFGKKAGGSDGGCFVEFTQLPEFVVVPYRPEYYVLPDLTDLICFRDTWFPSKAHVINVLSIKQARENDATLGFVNDGRYCDVYICCERLAAPGTSDEKKGKVAAHEILHALSEHNDCAHQNTWTPPGRCLLYSPVPASGFEDGYVEINEVHSNVIRASDKW